MLPGEPRGGAGLARRDRLPPFISDRWPLYLALWLVLVAAALFPVVADRLAAPDEPPLAPLLARLPSLTGEAGAIRLAWEPRPRPLAPRLQPRLALPQHPTLLHPWWWVLAQVGRGVEHAAPDLRWATFTILLAAVLILGLRALLRATLPDGGTRALAAVLIVLSGGWRWLHFAGAALDLVDRPWFYRQFWSAPLDALKQGTAFGSPIVDTWIAPERLAIVAAQAVLLACTAGALRAGSWRTAVIGWVGAGIALARRPAAHPGHLPHRSAGHYLGSSGGGRLGRGNGKTAAADHRRYPAGTRPGLAGVPLVPRPAADRAGVGRTSGGTPPGKSPGFLGAARVCAAGLGHGGCRWAGVGCRAYRWRRHAAASTHRGAPLTAGHSAVSSCSRSRWITPPCVPSTWRRSPSCRWPCSPPICWP